MSNVFRSVTIGTVAEHEDVQVSTSTVRWWERRGLIPPASRSSDGRRQYSPEEAERVRAFAKQRREGKRRPVAEGGAT